MYLSVYLIYILIYILSLNMIYFTDIDIYQNIYLYIFAVTESHTRDSNNEGVHLYSFPH